MLGNYESARRWNAEADRQKSQAVEPKEYWVRCENGGVTSGPFTETGARARAFDNALEFGCAYDVIHPEYDDKGPRTYAADVVAHFPAPGFKG